MNECSERVICCFQMPMAQARTISFFHTEQPRQHPSPPPPPPPQSNRTGGRRFNFSISKRAQLSLSSSSPTATANALGGQAANGVSETQILAADHDSTPTNVNDQTPQTKPFSSNKLLKRLKRYGISGVLSYGILNTVYYLGTFSFVWFYVVPTPGRMGYAAAVERFLKVMAMVWVGSQVTKLARAAGALALAPIVGRGLTWFTEKFKFKSEGKAFMAIVGVCLGIALLLFLVLTLLSA